MDNKDKNTEALAKRSWVGKVVDKLNKGHEFETTDEFGGGISVNVSPIIVVEGSQIQHSTISESIDNRAKENPSLAEVGTVASGLVGTLLGLLGKK